jgi:dihydrofolate reductase
MRKVVFGGANSLDNYFARKDDTFDWIMQSDESAKVMAEYFKTFDTIVMGRRTYDVAVASGHGDGSYGGMKTYVFSRTLKPRSTKSLEISSEDVVEFISRIKQEEGKDIYIMGGGLLAQPLLEANLIDEIGFNIHPLLLGSGIPIFHELSHQVDLELTECTSLKNGCVLVRYKVKPSVTKTTVRKTKSSSKRKSRS